MTTAAIRESDDLQGHVEAIFEHLGKRPTPGQLVIHIDNDCNAQKVEINSVHKVKKAVDKSRERSAE